MAPVVHELRCKRNVKVNLVHSGQHYDYEMSQDLFEKLDLPHPDVNLNIGSSTNAHQTAELLMGIEKLVSESRPDLVLAEGDTNTVLGAGLASIKLHVPFGHIEAGLRSYDRRMPEEINRSIADGCAQLCFAPTTRSAHNLLREGVGSNKVHVTGNTIVEVCKSQLLLARRKSKILGDLNIDRNVPLILLTAHRQENVDDPHRLENILKAIRALKEFRIVFPIHPRTKKRIESFGLGRVLKKSRNLLITRPLSYWDFLKILASSDVVLTDSGGVQEEALTLGVPCLALRYNTERPETVEIGGTILVGAETQMIVVGARHALLDREWREKLAKIENPLGDGRASKRIASISSSMSESRLRLDSSEHLEGGSAYFCLLPIRADLKLGRLQDRHRSVAFDLAYDRNGKPVVPRRSLLLRKGWHVQAFGQSQDLTRLVSSMKTPTTR